MIVLEKANIKYLKEIEEFRKETLTVETRISGGVGLEQAKDLAKWLKGEYVPHYGKVKEEIFLAFNEEKAMVGICDIRLEKNDFIEKYAGQIGYTVRPSERRKGYATEILKEAVKKADELGMKNLLVTCNENNTASSKVIENAKGKLESIIPHPGYPNVKRYKFLSE